MSISGTRSSAVDPRMKKFIFAERNGIHIIDLQKTIQCHQGSLRRRSARPSPSGKTRALRRHQEAGPAGHPEGSRALRHVLRQQPLARRHAHQLLHHQEVASSASRRSRRWRSTAPSRASPRRKSPASRRRRPSSRRTSAASRR
ncbi:MAG: 30S ribosomal protein S2 [Desulfomicrobium escambiense]|nr:30S ribosomal protein S2 [Desulfomicrobium escambiense]